MTSCCPKMRLVQGFISRGSLQSHLGLWGQKHTWAAHLEIPTDYLWDGFWRLECWNAVRLLQMLSPAWESTVSVAESSFLSTFLFSKFVNWSYIKVQPSSPPPQDLSLGSGIFFPLNLTGYKLVTWAHLATETCEEGERAWWAAGTGARGPGPRVTCGLQRGRE